MLFVFWFLLLVSFQSIPCLLMTWWDFITYTWILYHRAVAFWQSTMLLHHVHLFKPTLLMAQFTLGTCITNLWFAQEFLGGGDLFSLMQQYEPFPEYVVQFYCANILMGLEHVHSKQIIHRDLKPENMLVAKNGYLVMADFGLAKHAPSGRTYTLCGTADYKVSIALYSCVVNSLLTECSICNCVHFLYDVRD